MSDEEMKTTKNTPFFATPLFAWVLLFTFTPVGVICLWVFKHHHFIIRFILTLYFIQRFRMNLFVAVFLLVISFYQYLTAHHRYLFRFIGLTKTETKPKPMDIELEEWLQLNKDDYYKIIKEVGFNLEYDVKDQPNGLILKNDRETIGILFYWDQTIERIDVLKIADQMMEYEWDIGVMFTNQSYTLYALETTEKLECIHLYTLKELYQLINKDEWSQSLVHELILNINGNSTD